MAFAAALLAGPVLAQGGDGGAPGDAEDNAIVYQIPLQLEGGGFEMVKKFVVVGEGRAKVGKTQIGVDRRNQDRVDYSSAPLIGHLSEHRYDKEDFTPANQVGEARIDGDKLVIVLSMAGAPRTDEITGVAVMNQNFTFESRGALKSGDAVGYAGWDKAGEPLAPVYWIGGKRLLVLVRPFVVTDSALW